MDIVWKANESAVNCKFIAWIGFVFVCLFEEGAM